MSIKKPVSCTSLETDELEYDGGMSSEKKWCIAGMVVAGLCVVGSITAMGLSFSREYTVRGAKYPMTASETSAMRAKYSPATFDYLAMRTGSILMNKPLFFSGVAAGVVGGVGLAGSVYHFTHED